LQDNTLSVHSHPWSFIVREHVQCICEGGRSCSREDPARQPAAAAPIRGLHCSWVGGGVLAMARPWQDNLEKHDVARQFKEANIGLVLNLQEARGRPAKGWG
jgi:protein tyrosine phosphatase domain-containing protein 1